MKMRAIWLFGTLLTVGCASTPILDEPTDAGGAANGAAELERLPLFSGARISSDEAAENFQRASTTLELAGSVSRAMLRVQLESPCFPFDRWAELEIPAGQRWPEPCDAFDRTVSVALDVPESEDAAPGLELVRAVTPFGGPLSFEADVTDVVNGLPGEHRLSVKLDTWSDADGLVSGAKGEWLVSAELELERGPAPRRVLAVVPLALGAQTEPEGAPLGFEVPEGTKSARIDYRTTGHGGVFGAGCIGPAEEFCKRGHTLLLDGEPLSELLPWRSDCSTLCTITENDSGYGPTSYCAENPCGDPNSVRAPRANWCPGSVTPAFEIVGDALTEPGEHELSLTIDQLAAGAQWTISATYFAFE
jgi:hypothetical protein